jgi:hypothetical protein
VRLLAYALVVVVTVFVALFVGASLWAAVGPSDA